MAGRVAGWPPRWLTKVPLADRRRGDGAEFVEFFEGYCRGDKRTVAGRRGDLLRSRPWQTQLVSHLFARRREGRLRHSQALIGMARKNGKSGIGSGIALDGLVFGPEGGQVFTCASSKDQAKIVFGTTKTMVELDPELSELLVVYKDAIENPETGTVLMPTSAEAPLLEGLNPTLVVYDELHTAPNRELWDVFALAGGSREESLLVGITTAGVRYDRRGQDSHCFSLYEYGKAIVRGEVVDDSFFMAWWEPRNPGASTLDPRVWREGNPGFGDLNRAEDFANAVKKTTEAEFRTKRLNQWVSRSMTWLPPGAKAACDVPGVSVPDLADVVVSFDGSHNNDSTAVVVTSIEDVPVQRVVAAWERPPRETDPDWRVDVAEVEAVLREACRRWNVREVACDPYRWNRTMQVLAGEGLPVVEFPQSYNRMTPATQDYYEAVTSGKVRFDPADAVLTRHLESAVIKLSERGQRIAKETAKSERKIDAAVAAVMGLDRARWWRADLLKPRKRGGSGFRA